MAVDLHSRLRRGYDRGFLACVALDIGVIFTVGQLGPGAVSDNGWLDAAVIFSAAGLGGCLVSLVLDAVFGVKPDQAFHGSEIRLFIAAAAFSLFGLSCLLAYLAPSAAMSFGLFALIIATVIGYAVWMQRRAKRLSD